MTTLRWDDKDPGTEAKPVIKDYEIDWSGMLAEDETITASSWSVDVATITIETTGGYAASISGSKCIVWLSGGVAETTYSVTNHITTSRGMQDERTVLLTVREM